VHARSAAEPKARPAERGTRHLAALPKQLAHRLDRTDAPYLALTQEFMRAPRRTSDGRPAHWTEGGGYGLRPVEATVYAALVECIGVGPEDGKHGKFVPRAGNGGRAKINGAYLKKRYGFSYAQVGAAIKGLSVPNPCPHCARGHVLVVSRREGRGASYEFDLVRCQDLAPEECVAWDAALRAEGRRPQVTPIRKKQPSFDFGGGNGGDDGRPPDAPAKVSQNRDTFPRGSRRTMMVEVEAIPLIAEPVPVEPADPRVAIVAATALAFHGIALPERLALAIVGSVDASGSGDYDAALVAVLMGAAGRPLIDLAEADVRMLLQANPRFESAEEVSQNRDTFAPPPVPSTSAPARPAPRHVTGDWALDRILEGARRDEPGTTVETAERLRGEVVAAARRELGASASPRAIEDQVHDTLSREALHGRLGAPAPRGYVALLRSGIAASDPWLIRPHDPLARARKAYERRIPADARAAVEAHVLQHVRGRCGLDLELLKHHDITSRQMIDFVVAMVRARPEAESPP